MTQLELISSHSPRKKSSSQVELILIFYCKNTNSKDFFFLLKNFEGFALFGERERKTIAKTVVSGMEGLYSYFFIWVVILDDSLFT